MKVDLETLHLKKGTEKEIRRAQRGKTIEQHKGINTISRFIFSC